MKEEPNLTRHSEFLTALSFQAPRKVRRLLGFATMPQLHVLMKVLHCVCQGKIPIDRRDYGEIHRKKKLPFLRKHFEAKAALGRLLRASRRDKLAVLHQLLSVIPIALKQML